jgi:F-type H+-transporting ATPase subunit a
MVLVGTPALLPAQDPARPSAEHVVQGVASDEAAAHGGEAGHGDAAHADAAHGEGHEAHASHAPVLPNCIQVVNIIPMGDHTMGDTGFGKFLRTFERQFYLIFWVAVLALLFFSALRIATLKPGKVQVTIEMLVEGLTNFFTGIVGKEHVKHVPFLCSLFLFIWINNLTSLVPGFAPATGIFQTTVTLALLVFFYFIFYGIKDGGFGHFLWHLAGSPRDLVGWLISPVLFVLEVVGTLAKPLSLSLRLYGNIMGEDILLGVFLLLGIMLAGAVVPDPIIGVPLHLPFMFLVLLGSTIQALVFSLLAAIYLAMVLPHHDEEGHHDEHADEHPLFPGADEKNEKSGHVDAGVAPFV